MSRQGCEENCVQQPENVQLAAGAADDFFVVAAFGTAASRLVGCATLEAMKKVKRTTATAEIWILRKVIRHISYLITLKEQARSAWEHLLRKYEERSQSTNLQLQTARVIAGESGHAGRSKTMVILQFFGFEGPAMLANLC